MQYSPKQQYGIVIPTYKGHLAQVKLLLESFDRYCLDKDSTPFLLVVSSSELDEFQEMVRSVSKDLVVSVTSLKEIIKKQEGSTINEDALLHKIGKFNFQAIKKIYGVKHSEFDTALVLDSEALLIRPVKFASVFKNYLKKPFIIYSSFFGNDIQQQVTYLSCSILGKPKLNKWFLETQYWFFNKDDVAAMFSHVKKVTGESVFKNYCKHIPLFPEIFYFVYLYYFKKNTYTFINADTLLQKYLSFQEYITFRNKIEQNTLFEYAAWGFTNNLISGFTKIYKSLDLRFFKYDDRWLDSKNTKAQQKFISSNESIVLLPCRVVTAGFKVNGTLVPKNHDSKTNSPELINSTSWPSMLKSKVTSVPLVKKTHLYVTHMFKQYSFNRQFEEIKKSLDALGSYRLRKNKAATLKRDKTLAFDVGAFIGNSVDRIESLGYERIVCFEPSPPNFVQLFNRYKNNTHISFIWKAASNEAGQELTLFSDQFVPWLTTLHSDWLHQTRHSGDVNFVSKYQVTTTTLDTVIARIGAIPGYIKVDTEGHEAAVLQGLHHKPDMLSFEWISERKAQLLECLELCKEIGFTEFYISLREAVPEFDQEKPLTFKQAKKQADAICALDKNNNLGGNIWCR